MRVRLCAHDKRHDCSLGRAVKQNLTGVRIITKTRDTMALSEVELTRTLQREWGTVRASAALDASLPPMITRQWIKDGRRVGYVTQDYEALPVDTSLVEASIAPACAPTLLEKYWAVRTLDDAQDVTWEPSLNLHLVRIRPGALTIADACILTAQAKQLHARFAAAGSDRLATTGNGRGPAQSFRLHVKALLIGESSDPSVERLTMASLDDVVSLRAAVFSFSAMDGFRFEGVPDFDAWHEHSAAKVRADLIEATIGHDALAQSDWHWKGVNDGPLYDATVRLTVHRGRVL